MPKLNWFWVIVLSLIYIVMGVFMGLRFFNNSENAVLNINDREFYPSFNLNVKCMDLDSSIITENDNIRCEYTINSPEEMSVLPSNPKLFLYDAVVENSINDFGDTNLGFQDAYTKKDKLFLREFSFYPKSEGRYYLEFSSEVYSPPVYYELIEESELSLDILFEEDAVYFLDQNRSDNKSKRIETDNLEITIKCFDYVMLWPNYNSARCEAILKNKQNKILHALTRFSIFKNGQDITYNDTLIQLDSIMFKLDDKPTIHTKLSDNQENIKYAWFYVKEQGNYSLKVKTEVVNTNLLESKWKTSQLQLPFKVISREEFLKKEEMNITLFVALLTAILFSVPVALKAIRDLITEDHHERK